jgi:glycosidase
MKKLFLPLFISLFLIACSDNPPHQVESSKQENSTPASQELKHVAWSENATIYEANIRQMTPEGTFKALENQLNSIRDLGVEIIWLMPVQPIGKLNRKGGMGSYYSVMDYTAVNPEFGSMDDFKSLVNKAHELDMKILIDWVANHTAWDNVWTIDHPEWFTKDADGNFVPPVPDWSDVIDLNYDNMQMRAAMIDAMKYWVPKPILMVSDVMLPEWCLPIFGMKRAKS